MQQQNKQIRDSKEYCKLKLFRSNFNFLFRFMLTIHQEWSEIFVSNQSRIEILSSLMQSIKTAGRKITIPRILDSTQFKITV